MKKERNEFKTKFEELQRKSIQLENTNESLETENRAAGLMLRQYGQRVDKTMEELSLLQFELEQSKESGQQQVARLKMQLKESEDQLYVLKLKHQKFNGESVARRSRLSSCSMDSEPLQTIPKQNPDFSSIFNSHNFNRQRDCPPLTQSMSLVQSLIKEIADRHLATAHA